MRGLLASEPAPAHALGLASWVALAAAMALSAAAAWFVFVRPWRIEATLKAATKGAIVSLGAGVNVAGFSASAAALLGGPGVVAVHFRSKELWRRAVPQVSVEALLVWVEKTLDTPQEPSTSRWPPWVTRALARAKEWLRQRTDLDQLPHLGAQLLFDLVDLKLHGTLHCGFEDPALTGRAAAVLYPLSGVLSPLGVCDVSFDWSGRTVLDGDVDLSFSVVLGRVLRRGLRFLWNHVHLRRTPQPSAKSPSLLVDQAQ